MHIPFSRTHELFGETSPIDLVLRLVKATTEVRKAQTALNKEDGDE